MVSSSLRTVSSNCSARERLIYPEDLVQSEVCVSVRKVSLDRSWCRRFLMSLDREPLFPAGRRNYSRISFLRCSDICITYQIIISAVGNGLIGQQNFEWLTKRSHLRDLREVIIEFQMSTTKTITLSMESLNKLYFQFFERFVIPNLLKNVNEITQLLRNKTAYDVYKYLEELLAKNENNDGYTSNQVINTLNASLPSLTSPPPLYQYALPTNGDHPKSSNTEIHKPFDKEKGLEDSMSFKNKLGIRRTLTGLAFDEPPKTFEFRNYSDEANQSPSIYTNPTSLNNLSSLNNDFKLDFPSRDPLSLMPNLGKGNSVFDQEAKSKTMKDIVRKIGKIFNDNHSKIEKYNKNSSQSNKLFNINTSTRLQKKEQGRKEYQFLTKGDPQVRKY